MKRQSFFLLALAALGFGAASCVVDDDYGSWDDRRRYSHDRYAYYDDYDDYDYGDYDYRHERRPPPPRRGDRDSYHDRGGREVRLEAAPGGKAKGFVPAGTFQAGGAAESGVPGGGPIRTVRLTATSGSVAVNTIVVREGSSKTSYTVSRRLEAGESVDVDLGGAKAATGIRVSTGGKGAYQVLVR